MAHQFYELSEGILFRKCSLFDEENHTSKGDCTNFYNKEVRFVEYYHCHQYGIHFHCKKHPNIELEEDYPYGNTNFFCPKCNTVVYSGNKDELVKKCLRLINSQEFNDCELVRIEDYYYPELKEKIKLPQDTNYWMRVDIKQDKFGRCVIVLYIGNKDSKEKSQFFIKPEALQLSTDYKDLDPAKVLAKIEVVLKNRILSQTYNED